MECKFVVGQKCVSIADWSALKAALPDIQFPEDGTIYTVRDVGVFCQGIGIRLKEIVNQPRHTIDGFIENAFLALLFRPLNDRPKEADTDISVLYPLLATTGPWGAPTPEQTPAPVKAPELEPAT